MINGITTIQTLFAHMLPMGWLRLVGSLKLHVSFAEYHLFYRALLQKRPIILRSLLSIATPSNTPRTHISYVCSTYPKIESQLYQYLVHTYFQFLCVTTELEELEICVSVTVSLSMSEEELEICVHQVLV